MKILVTGGAGMLGHKVVQRLGRSADVWWTLRTTVQDPALAPVPALRGDRAIERFDALDPAAVSAALRAIRPDIVVNCLGVIKQATGAGEETMIAINARLPHLLANELRGWHGRLIQISTDCVFSGARGNYAENDAPDATDLYGQSKAAGEVHADNVLVLRTSIIGRELKRHRSLLDWFLQQRGHVRGFRRAIWSGVTTRQLSDVIRAMIDRYPDLNGIYHVSSGRTSKFALLMELRHAYGVDVEILPDDSFVCDRSLDGTRFEAATGFRCPAMSTMIEDMVADPTPYQLPT